MATDALAPDTRRCIETLPLRAVTDPATSDVAAIPQHASDALLLLNTTVAWTTAWTPAWAADGEADGEADEGETATATLHPGGCAALSTARVARDALARPLRRRACAKQSEAEATAVVHAFWLGAGAGGEGEGEGGGPCPPQSPPFHPVTMPPCCRVCMAPLSLR